MLWSLYGKEDDEAPVKFGFTPELRAELAKERTTEELMSIAKECDLIGDIVVLCRNNDFGFDINLLKGRIVRDGDEFFLSPDSEPTSLFKLQDPLPDDTNLDLINQDSTWVVVIRAEKTDESYVSVVYKDEADVDPDDAVIDYVAYRCIFHSGVKTARELGRLLNRGHKILRAKGEIASFGNQKPPNIFPLGGLKKE